MLIITFGCIAGWRRTGKTARQAQPEAAHLVAAHVTDMFEQQLIEGIHVVVLRRGHLFQHVWMAANCALTEDHHAAGQDVCPFHGDGNRCALIAARQEVAFAEHNAFTACDIHRVNDRLLRAVGTVVFHNRGQHGRFFAQHNAVGNQRCGGIHHVGITCDTRQRLFDTFHLADGDFELTADVRVGTNPHRHRLQTAG